MSEKRLFNDGWTFLKQDLSEPKPSFFDARDGFIPVEIPHDWLIYDTRRLYEDSRGCYRKTFDCVKESGMRYSLRFEGVYMDSEYYLNGEKVFEWKYGYSTFEFDITDSLRSGGNEILVIVTCQAPNSRWYSGAGIYRNVWLKEMPECRFVPDGITVTALPCEDGCWKAEVDAEICSDGEYKPVCLRYAVFEEGAQAGQAGRAADHADAEGAGEAAEWLGSPGSVAELVISTPKLWDIESPARYVLRAELTSERNGVRYCDREEIVFGLRTIRFDPDQGFFLNGRRVKLHGVCLHHDLGALGAAVNKASLRRQLTVMKEMGANAVRTSHNMPSVEMMELADEMGILVVSESFDCWERSKTPYDYARFFRDWAAKDVESWIRRDRNHPSVIMWSIGNEIYDTHADGRGLELTAYLAALVRKHDPRGHAPVTIGSNYMPWENAQKCADLLKLAGYNYAEKYYDDHHRLHPDWIIYGSETSSTVQSRGIYHFPLKQPVLADDDGQCSSLGNSSTSWGAKNTEACIIADRDAEYSPGQFLWSGFDYIGEPTPYHTKNSYFGQVDTAGFPKDSYYIYQAEWTDYRVKPMIHIFPYWDFNPGQLIDVRVCSNAPKIELFFNDRSLGICDLDHFHGDKLLGEWQIPYKKGRLLANALDLNGNIIASDTVTSFEDAERLIIKSDRKEIEAGGRDLAFAEISACDREGHPVGNAVCRVTVAVSGVGRLVGLDNGDSTDYDQYKGTSRRMFSGKLLAIIAPDTAPGDICVTVSSPGLVPAELRLKVKPCKTVPGSSLTLARNEGTGTDLPLDEIPVRKIELTVKSPDTEGRRTEEPEADRQGIGQRTERQETETDTVTGAGLRDTSRKEEYGKTGVERRVVTLTPERPEVLIESLLYPANTSYRELEWRITNDAGIDVTNAVLTAEGGRAVLRAKHDGRIRVRCLTRNGTDRITMFSQLEFDIEGFGKAFLNPYRLIAGGLYQESNRELTNGNEHGVATARDGESQIGFREVDFGEFGSDEITLRIFAMSPEPLPVGVFLGMPGEEGSVQLGTLCYDRGSVWNTYQDQTFRLQKRLKGVHTLCFTVDRKVHFGGFYFTEQKKAYARLCAPEYSNIYGDAYRIAGNAVEDIGNNVTLEYENMDFGEEGADAIRICGRSAIPENTIHIRFADDKDTDGRIVEFRGSRNYEVQEFRLGRVTGKKKVLFLFLPGSRFDLAWFQFFRSSDADTRCSSAELRLP